MPLGALSIEISPPAALFENQASLRAHLLEALLQSATDYAILAFDVDGLVIVWNEGARHVTGWSEAEMLGHPGIIFFTEEDRRDGVPQAEMCAALQHGRASDERWHVRRDGSRFWANGEMMPLRNGDGLHIGFLKILRDRTPQRLAAEAQRADAEFMRSVLASSADCIKVLDLDAKLIFMSEGGQKVMEVSDFNAIEGCPWPDFWRDENNTLARAAVASAKAGGVGRFQGAADTMAGNPRYWDVQVTPIPGADGTPERLLSVSRDVSDQHRAEALLHDSEEQRRLAVEAANIGIWSFDVATRTLHWDDRCRSLFGLAAAADVTCDTYLAGLHPADRARVADISRTVHDPAGSGTYHAEYRTIGAADGVERWVDATGKAYFADGRVIRLVGTARDITVRKRAEERARLLGDELQHRIKNTLATVQAIVRQTLRSSATPAEAQAAVDLRLVALGRANALLTSDRWHGSDLLQAAKTALAPHDDGMPGRFRIAGPPAWLPAEAAMSASLMLNELATNAAKYGSLSNAGGSVELTWKVGEEPAPDGCRSLRLVWQERGGPPVLPPAKRGFGSRLIERGLASALGGTAELEFAREGVICRVEGRLLSGPSE